MLREAVKRVLPTRAYRSLRRQVKNYRQRKRDRGPKFSEAQFRQFLADKLQIKQGAVVFVHSSIDGMNLGFSFLRVLPILRELVGEQGTLLFPCYSVTGRAEDYLRRGEVFDVRKTVTVMGLIPELARRMPDAVRSLHPTNSVVAVGCHAQALTDTHQDSIYPCDRESPYHKIVAHDGIIVGLGVSMESLSFVHCIEDIRRERFPLKARTDEVFEATVIDREGHEQKVRTLAAAARIGYRNVSRYCRKHIPEDILRSFVVNGANYFVAKSPELYAKMDELTERGITIYTKKAWKS